MTQTSAQTAQATDAPFVAYLDQVLAAAKEQSGDSGEFVPEAARGRHRAPFPAGAAQEIERIDTLVTRLEQFKQWLVEDPRMLFVVDTYLSDRVKESARRIQQEMKWENRKENLIVATLTTIGGSILGWILSSLLGTPGDLFHLFGW